MPKRLATWLLRALIDAGGPARNMESGKDTPNSESIGFGRNGKERKGKDRDGDKKPLRFRKTGPQDIRSGEQISSPATASSVPNWTWEAAVGSEKRRTQYHTCEMPVNLWGEVHHLTDAREQAWCLSEDAAAVMEVRRSSPTRFPSDKRPRRDAAGGTSAWRAGRQATKTKVEDVIPIVPAATAGIQEQNLLCECISSILLSSAQLSSADPDVNSQPSLESSRATASSQGALSPTVYVDLEVYRDTRREQLVPDLGRHGGTKTVLSI
ncbi:hypothetical protein MBM_08288 [Drepanopeziza brunnea f. sp. 'multigermtubi' MB_m1]|uniref:Uncharacterized protein n=1 Tax=Marssonina brunnea f. sp. multigermtubi (strain MB_m1) TaxID=1072389 RepID=K1W8P6_MARBU|nr:uncharacterized protein MBM_08288 [Drepanopeziza brunnea f. sp. 'multigermtubi' MB_m1]EKD13570.1 hypothetical protein MBM_08288 [Drepanopeziza brunnea f. sp. 'multigermtubi' MB_m1]